MSPATIALIGVSAGAVLALLVAWIRWSITTAVRLSIQTTVNGKVDAVQRTANELQRSIDDIAERQKAHNSTHLVEQAALLAALARQGMDIPDGWGGHQ
jgi:uncharacterized membrane protein YccC